MSSKAGNQPASRRPARRRTLSRPLVRLLPVVITVAVFIGLGYPTLRGWLHLRGESHTAEEETHQLDSRIADLEAEIELRTSEEGVVRKALCFGPFVEPGSEVYAIAGVAGCVNAPTQP